MSVGAEIEAAERVLVVVAHPDDETLGCGALLSRLRDVTVLHVTDGAPRGGADAGRHGFADAAAYAAARWLEARAALALAGVPATRHVGLGRPDQGASDDLGALARRLRPFLSRADAVLTHAFEGGHPDHDAVAFAVHAAARLVAGEGAGIGLLAEMPFYHAGAEGWVRQRFRPRPGAAPETVLDLSPAERALKVRMAAAHRSQREVLAGFDLDLERFRPAPAYDFLVLPERLLYEHHGWNMTRARWTERVLAAETELWGQAAR